MSLISGHSQMEQAYQPTMWSKVFHSVPHVNITFHPVDPRFNPKNELYLESLGIIASVPAAWLITTLVVLLIYLCTRCCDTKSTKKRKSRPMRCCLSFFALVTCAALAVGFLGNHVLHNGIEGFEHSLQNINDVIRRAQQMAKRYNNVFNNEISANLNKLYDGPFQREIRENTGAHFNLMDNCDRVLNNISAGLEAMDQLRFAIDAVDSPHTAQNERLRFLLVPEYTHAVEKFRWPVTMGVQALFAIFCLLLFIGAMVHSRCVLIVFSICGLFSIIVLWLLSSVYIASAVALADFCHKPSPWVQYALGEQLDYDVSEYYLSCRPGVSNPFDNFLSKSRAAINDIELHVRQIEGTARKYYSQVELDPFLRDLEDHVRDTAGVMEGLGKELECKQVHRAYNMALVSLCDTGLIGLILMFLSVSLSGLLFTALVWCNSHTWIYFKHKGRYIKVDDQDPYMPLSTIERPRLTAASAGGANSTGSLMHPAAAGTLNSSSGLGYMNRQRSLGAGIGQTPPATPPYHGTLNGVSSNNGGKAPYLRQQHSTGSMGYGHLSGAGHYTLGPSARSTAGGSLMPSATMGRPTHHGHHAMSNAGSSAGAGHSQYQPQYSVGSTATTTMAGRTQQGAYKGMDNLPATMTLGRRGHYASLRSSGGATGTAGRGGASGMGDTGDPLLGPNMGQYATLSKNVKTLESSDFY